MKNIKIATSILLSLISLSMILTGCSSNKTDLLNELFEENNMDTLVKNNGSVMFHSTDVFSDGEKIEYDVYEDSDKYVYSSDSQLLIIDSNEDIYGYNIDENGKTTNFKLFCLFDSKEEYIYNNKWDTIFEDADLEKVKNTETKNGLIYIDTYQTKEIEGASEYYGYNPANAESIHYKYIFDESTHENMECSMYLIMKDGSENYIAGINRIEEPSDLSVNYVEADPEVVGTRTVTIIANPGTDEETVIDATVLKGYSASIYPGSDYEAKLYSNPECTEEFHVVDYESDVTVYLKK